MPRTEAQRAKSRTWNAHRRRMIAYGRWNPFVNADPARKRLLELQQAGVGRRRAAQLTGLHPQILSAILYGRGGKPPAGKIRHATEEAILAVEPSPQIALPDRPVPGLTRATTAVDATGTHRRIQAMVANAHTLADIARMMGSGNPGAVRPVLFQQTVTAATAAAFTEVYNRAGHLQADPATPRGRRWAQAARKLAKDNGWLPSIAWEEHDIDRPDAEPVPGWQDHQWRPLRGAAHWEALAEDVEFLATTQGLSIGQIAERMGMSEPNLLHRLADGRDAAASGPELAMEAG